MENRFVIIGNYFSKIHDLIGVDSDYKLGVTADHKFHQSDVILDSMTAVKEKLPCVLKDIKHNYQGVYKNNYYTLYMEYGLVGITDTDNNKCYIGLKEHLFSSKSFYLIRSVVNKHVIRLIYKTYVPLHAGGVLTKDDKALLFIGTHGAGKSTLTRHFQNLGHLLINDDTVVFDPYDSTVAGFSEGLYIRSDFALKYGNIDGFEPMKEIAPGRKFFAENPNKVIHQHKKVSCIVLLDRDFNKCFDSHCSIYEASRLFWQSHCDWCRSSVEINKMNNAFDTLYRNSKMIYANLCCTDELELFLSREAYL